MKLSDEERQFNEWKKANNQMLSFMFSGKLMKVWRQKNVSDYINQIIEINNEQPNRYLLAHSTLMKSIGKYFYLLDWKYRFEVPLGDLDSSYRFDIMAQKGRNTIIVEVKPQVTTRDLGQIQGYAHDISKKMKKSRVFLGTDILNLGNLFEGEIFDIITNSAEDLELGIILANRQQAWLIPAEFLLV